MDSLTCTECQNHQHQPPLLQLSAEPDAPSHFPVGLFRLAPSPAPRPLPPSPHPSNLVTMACMSSVAWNKTHPGVPNTVVQGHTCYFNSPPPLPSLFPHTEGRLSAWPVLFLSVHRSVSLNCHTPRWTAKTVPAILTGCSSHRTSQALRVIWCTRCTCRWQQERPVQRLNDSPSPV